MPWTTTSPTPPDIQGYQTACEKRQLLQQGNERPNQGQPRHSNGETEEKQGLDCRGKGRPHPVVELKCLDSRLEMRSAKKGMEEEQETCRQPKILADRRRSSLDKPPLTRMP
ncbi:hypothetical protein MHYP_G00127200 [Metynnis hypsauchen]